MKGLNVTTQVKHSEKNTAWNVVGMNPGGKYKIARVPYILTGNEIIDTKAKNEALEHAQFISMCCTNSESIIQKMKF